MWKENKYNLATDGNANNQIKLFSIYLDIKFVFNCHLILDTSSEWIKITWRNLSSWKPHFVAIQILSFAYCDSLHWRSRAIDSFCHETIIITMQLLITQVTYVSLVNKIILFKISETYCLILLMLRRNMIPHIVVLISL